MFSGNGESIALDRFRGLDVSPKTSLEFIFSYYQIGGVRIFANKIKQFGRRIQMATINWYCNILDLGQDIYSWGKIKIAWPFVNAMENTVSIYVGRSHYLSLQIIAKDQRTISVLNLWHC